MWTYSDGARTVKAHWAAGRWVLLDPATGDTAGEVRAGEFSRRFRPLDEFADVTRSGTYLGTLSGPDGTAVVDLLLDRNPFMLANGPRRLARPHVLIVPRRHRDGWSSATAGELAARSTAMTLVAAWYQDLDGGQAVFAANDSPPNLDYLRDQEGGTPPVPVVGRNPRQDVQHAHLHAFYAEGGETENHESSALAVGQRAYTETLGGDAVRVNGGAAQFAAETGAAAQSWGGAYCSYQRGLDGPVQVMPPLGSSQAEFNQRLARADGLQAGPDPKLGGAVNLFRLGLDDPARREAAEQATVRHRAGFETFAHMRGLNPPALAG